MENLVWFITGCSSGFGKALAKNILLKKGKVIATARDISSLKDLELQGAITMQLDVTSSMLELKKAAETGILHYGRIDILVNNAGYVLQGAIEECSPEETFNQFNTNVLGPLNLIRSFLPHMRQKKFGLIINIGSMASYSSVPGAGLYCASKAAMRQISESLHKEVEPQGIHVLLVEPGFFQTSLLDKMIQHSTMPEYISSVGKTKIFLKNYSGQQPGDANKAVDIITDLVLQFVTKKNTLPLRLALGSDAYNTIKNELEAGLKDNELMKELSIASDF